jgi:hypothetical protein
MLSTEQKKEAIRQYKERKAAAGIYAVRCPATSRVWVGASRNLDATRNGLWFSLRAGAHRDTTLQREWTARGESAFTYEPLETLPDDTPALAVTDRLKERKQHWISTLSAEGLL